MDYKLLWQLETEAFELLENDYHKLKTENIKLKENLRKTSVKLEQLNEAVKVATQPNDLTIKWRNL
jgi:prefoldin subunit 5